MLGGRKTKAYVCALVAMAAIACGKKTTRTRSNVETPAVELQGEPLAPIPDVPPEDARAVALGAKLFYDPLLSVDQTMACGSCHVIPQGGDDNRQTALGIRGQIGPINTPTVLNSALNFAQFWDGRAATLEDQAGGPIENPLEMGNSLPKLLASLKANTDYAREFSAAFGDGITERNLRAALAAFERTLLTKNSRFDRWLRGETSALATNELAGYELFKSVGCVACHQGANAGGNMFERLGVMGEYFKDRGNVTTADYGRFNVTHLERDRFAFKVPSLRVAALTAPYFHDGSAPTLDQAVRTMARYQLGRALSDGDVSLLVAFIESLAGDLPAVPPEALKLAARGKQP